jgi:hypothetical protein
MGTAACDLTSYFEDNQLGVMLLSVDFTGFTGFLV